MRHSLLAVFLTATACGSMESDATGSPPAGSGTISSAQSAVPSGATGLTLSATSIVGGASLTGTVFAGSGAVVYLDFPRTLFAGPRFVRIPSGQGNATFVLASNPFTAGPTTATISAMTQSPNPFSYLPRQVTVVPSPTPPVTARPEVASLALAPATVTSGTSSTGTLTLTGPAPAGGAAVQVAIPNDFFGLDAGAPAMVLVPAGATSAAFAIQTHLSNGAASSVTENVVASYFGGPFQGATLTVNAR